jgi:hypothetical protein
LICKLIELFSFIILIIMLCQETLEKLRKKCWQKRVLMNALYPTWVEGDPNDQSHLQLFMSQRMWSTLKMGKWIIDSDFDNFLAACSLAFQQQNTINLYFLKLRNTEAKHDDPAVQAVLRNVLDAEETKLSVSSLCEKLQTTRKWEDDLMSVEDGHLIPIEAKLASVKNLHLKATQTANNAAKMSQAEIQKQKEALEAHIREMQQNQKAEAEEARRAAATEKLKKDLAKKKKELEVQRANELQKAEASLAKAAKQGDEVAEAAAAAAKEAIKARDLDALAARAIHDDDGDNNMVII